MVQFLTSAVATLIAGLLADYIFEPAMMPGGTLSPIFGSIFGTSKGAGMALMYVICSKFDVVKVEDIQKANKIPTLLRKTPI